MLNINLNIYSISKLNEYIKYVEKFVSMKYDKKFQSFFESKVLEVAKEISSRLVTGGTTNDEYIDLYINSNKTRETDNGFILYNDASIDVNSDNSENYPNGKFCLALAFEYGVGITGEGTYNSDNFTPWEYNVNDYNFGWYYKKGNGVEHTYGYMGFEVYRNIAIYFKNQSNIKNIVNEYFKSR